MRYFNSLADLIGNTPLVRLNHVGVPEGARLFAKLELMNPLGSVKDRTGKYMVEAAERDGSLKPGGTIVEATAGNTGLRIAFAALNKGLASRRKIFQICHSLCSGSVESWKNGPEASTALRRRS